MLSRFEDLIRSIFLANLVRLLYRERTCRCNPDCIKDENASARLIVMNFNVIIRFLTVHHCNGLKKLNYKNITN